jgi:ubiquinone/menaquinone biosynthesis C-methylase UbiE
MLGVDEPDCVTLTRESYDRTAVVYAERFHQHLDDKPVDLAVVTAFAGLILKGENRHVLDVGCGTGVTTALLDGCGVKASGVDLSSSMVSQARRLNPGLQFSVESMTGLDVADESVGGICAWYSIIHVPDEHLPGVFSEFRRVLVPGGLVLLAFQVGDEPLVLTSALLAPDMIRAPGVSPTALTRPYR